MAQKVHQLFQLLEKDHREAEQMMKQLSSRLAEPAGGHLCPTEGRADGAHAGGGKVFLPETEADQ